MTTQISREDALKDLRGVLNIRSYLLAWRGKVVSWIKFSFFFAYFFGCAWWFGDWDGFAQFIVKGSTVVYGGIMTLSLLRLLAAQGALSSSIRHEREIRFFLHKKYQMTENEMDREIK